MSKARLHPTVLDFRGAMGNMLFRRRNGKLYASIKSPGTTKEPTEAQTSHRERFSEAVAWGKRALKNEELLGLYKAIAAEKGTSAFNVALADFLKPPSIRELDLSGYRGQPGDTISFLTRDDVAVVRAVVAITDADSHMIESGEAVETEPGTGEWVYTATSIVPAETTVTIRVVAIDHPGGTGILAETILL